MTSSWTQRIVTHDETHTALSYLALMIKHINPTFALQDTTPVRISPDKIFNTQTEITAVGGMRPSCLNAIEGLLTTWFGAPAERNENTCDGELHGLHLKYSNGIVINYMLHRDNGISITLPKTTANTLAEHVSRTQTELSDKKSQSPIAI